MLRLVRQDNLLCLKKKFKPITTDSNHGLPVYPNLLKSTKIAGLNQVWASDITYFQYLSRGGSGFIQQKVHRVGSWQKYGTSIGHERLNRALKNRGTESTHGLIQHSDQGVQYASQDILIVSKSTTSRSACHGKEIHTIMCC